MPRREELLIELEREERHLSALRGGVEGVLRRIERLRVELAALSQPALHVSEAVTTFGLSTPPHRRLSSEEKVALFRSLFRGREDVFPRRWENPKTGRSGYAPACSNEWLVGICRKKGLAGARRPGTVCGDCPSKAFVPVSDAEIQRHLQGKHVMGVYPMLADECCHFLAADFDGEGWEEDIRAFREVCRSQGVEPAIERSRSGNGAHAWFFFSGPVAAQTARRFGCSLLTQTMSRRHELSMRSYDRLFPNQDTLPKGGFGNLIAMPLQWHARKNGNTIFLDDTLLPYTDQWGFLASVGRLDPLLVQRIADAAERRGEVIGARGDEPYDNYQAKPWQRPPSGEPPPLVVSTPLPNRVSSVLAQRLFVEKTGLPSPVVSRLKRLAAFQNPEFYKKQAMRLSTALTPRVISCFEDTGQYIALPRGCQEEAAALLESLGVAVEVTDERTTGDEARFDFQGELTAEQERAAQTMLESEAGVMVAPPGAGKTVVGAYLIAARARSTLVLVHRRPLLDQWVSQLSRFLGVATEDVGRIVGGVWRPNGVLDVAMLQSVVRKGRVDDFVASYGHVLVDECHHVAAFSFERVLAEVKAKYILGLTATPERRDGHQPIIRMQIGPTRVRLGSSRGGWEHDLRRTVLVRESGTVLTGGEELGIQQIYAVLAQDENRNQLILDDVLRAVRAGRSPIVLTERRDHLELLAAGLRAATDNVMVLQGGMRVKTRRALMERLASIPDTEPRVLLATGRYVGEGFDDSRLDTLFLTLPVSWRGTLVQYVGRLHRQHGGKTSVQVYDYADSGIPVLARMLQRRLRGYRAMGYNLEGESSRDKQTATRFPGEADDPYAS
jgi:superfamily II DNA or RNA helicase